MKTILQKTFYLVLVGVLSSISFQSAWAQTQLAAWTFDATAAAPSTPNTLLANLGLQSTTASLYANGTNGSSSWASTELTTFGGTTINDPRTSPLNGNAYTLLGGTANSANGKSIVFKFSTTGFENPILTFASRGTATGFLTHQWSWSTDGTTFTNFGTNTVVNGSTFILKTLDLTAIDAVDNQGAVYLKLTVTGASSASGNNRLDNFVVMATALASSGPIAATLSASSLSTTGATLNGTINANGTSTNGSFEYGLTTAYGSTIASTPASVSTSVAENISAAISSLDVNTLYHYRAVGTQGATVVDGNDLSFYTLANVPNAPTVSGETLNSLLVSVPTTDGNPASTLYAIRVDGSQYVQASGALGGSEVWQTAATWNTVMVTGLTPATVYVFDAKARNGANVETAFSSTTTASTLAPLAAPVATAASNITATSFDANWNSVSGATSYQLDVSTSPTFGTVTNLSNLIISEYGEGSGGSKKYIELYNGTGSSVDLANYEIWKNVNGSNWNFNSTNTTPTTPLSLTGMLANGATYVIANNATDVLGANLYNGFLSFNGDDATGLAYNGGSGSTFALIDVVGEEGVDPGSGWAVAGVNNATVDKILIRKPTVFVGNTNWTTSRGTSTSDSEWTVSSGTYSSTADTTDLGSHTCDNYTPSFVTGYDNLSVSGLTQTVSGLTLGTQYYYRVRAVNATETSANSNVISVTTVNPAYITQLNPHSCGSTLAQIYTNITAISISGADGYRFKVTDMSDNSVQTIDKTGPSFSLTQLASYAFAREYSVEVMISISGNFVGYYGAACSIYSPGYSVTPVTVGPAAVVAAQRGAALPTIYSTIFSNGIAGVSDYSFEVTNTITNLVQTFDNTRPYFRLTNLPFYTYATPYSIRVAVKTTSSDYGPFGDAYIVNSPAIPMITECGSHVNAGGTIHLGPALSSVTNYEFNVNDGTTTQVINRNVPFFSTNLITGYDIETIYTITVRVTSTDLVSPFGLPCTINPVLIDRINAGATSSDFNAVAYPNPFATNFKLDVSTSSSEVINVAVYDMVGKMLNNQAINASDISVLEIGNEFATGIYNIVISQGENTKTIRMIKN